MATRPYRAFALVLLFAAAAVALRADLPAPAPAPAPEPASPVVPIAFLPVFVRHRRAARIVLSVGVAAGFACAAASLALLYRDGAGLAAGTTGAASVRRDLLAFSASTVLLSFSAVLFDALGPQASATSRE